MPAKSAKSMKMIFIHAFLTLCLICLKLSNSNPVPKEIFKYGKYIDQSNQPEHINQLQQQLILEEVIRYSQHDNLLKAENADASSYTSFEQFATVNAQQINDAFIQNEETCGNLSLNSQQCYEDCIPYLSPLSLFIDIDNETIFEELFTVLGWYQMSGGPIAWYATGNPDMCEYNEGNYCFTPILFADPTTGFTMRVQDHGCCVPASCVGEDAEKVLHENFWCYGGYETVYADLMFGGMANVTTICDPIPRDFSSAGFSMVVAVFIIFVLCVIIASIRTQFLIEQEEENKELSNVHILSERLKDIKEDEANSPRKLEQQEKQIKAPKQQNVWDRHWFLYSFSIQNTWKIFVKRRPSDKSQFNFLDGIRVASMSWVIYGHVYVSYLMSSPSNQTILMPFSPDVKPYDYVFTQFYMMFAEYAFFSVDSFYYLSGFLAAFAIWRQIQRYGKKVFKLSYQWIPLCIINRILRLLPMMTFVMFIQWFVSDQLPYGYRVNSRDYNAELCSNSWYKVLLFYANLMPDMDDLGCMGHLWYIQCDMQMFLLIPFILLIFSWNKIYGAATAFLLFLTGIAIRSYFAIHWHFSANFLLPANPSINGGDQQRQYFQPWGRFGPYYGGVFTMLLILTLKEKNFEIRSRLSYFAIICFSGFIMCCLVFWPYDDVKDAPEERWGLTSNQIYYALCRPAWGAALGILSFALVFKRKIMSSMIGTLLSAEIYQPLGKLTYTMYLIHMMLLGWYFADLDMPLYYEYWDILCIFCCFWLLTMFITMILWFTMEQPIANMIGLGMKALIGKLGGKGKKNRKQKSKLSMDSELMDIKKSIVVLKKTGNNNGHDIKDKLLVTSISREGNGNNNTMGERSMTATYGTGNYESFMDDSIKSSNS